MSVKLVTWISQNCLPCTCKGTVNVILCTVFNKTIEGQILESAKTSGCESGSWKYTIQYDSDDLPDGVTALATTDISNVACKGCLTTWIEERLSQVVASQEHETLLDFSGDPDESTQSIYLTVENPSSVQVLRGFLSWDWGWNVGATLDGSTSLRGGIISEAYEDGVAISNTLDSNNFFQFIPENGDNVGFYVAGTSGKVPIDIDPGDSVQFELRFTSQNQDDIETLRVTHPRLSFFGSTTLA